MKKVLFLFVVMLTSGLLAQEVLDRVVAVVDNEIITKSELDFQVSLLAAQQRVDAADKQVRHQVLNSMIEEKLLYAQAKLDSITVTDEEVTRHVDYRIDLITQQYGSRERVEELYGMSLEKIKRELKEDARKYLMAENLKRSKFGMVDATRHEVEEFFEDYKDSLGLIPEKYKIAHIFVNPKASEKVKQSARNMARNLLDSLKAGKDFAELAKKYSEDPGSGADGGDLGFTKRGRLVPEFEAAAFALRKNEISDVVESPFGFHIIQLLERQGESIHSRHILIKIKNDEDADLKAIEFLNDIRDSIRRKEGTFEQYARKYSDDKQTNKFGGVLGTFDVGQLDKNLLDVVTKLKEGEISFPKRVDLGGGVYGYHIVYLMDQTPEHKPDIANDYNEIKQLAEYNKQQKLYVEWLKEVKENIFWEIRI